MFVSYTTLAASKLVW